MTKSCVVIEDDTPCDDEVTTSYQTVMKTGSDDKELLTLRIQVCERHASVIKLEQLWDSQG